MNATHLILITVVAHAFYSEPANAQQRSFKDLLFQSRSAAPIVLGLLPRYY